MPFELASTSQFKKDYKRAKKRGFNMRELHAVLERLCSEQPLEEKNRDHALSGAYAGFRECHIKPDWLLVYSINKEKLILVASRTGTHADLFDE